MSARRWCGGSLAALVPLIFTALHPVLCGWVDQATDQRVCPGGTAEFTWEYDPTVNNLVGLSIYKSGIPPRTILTRTGNGSAELKSAKATYLPNAGLRLDNVDATDSGEYQIQAIFKSDPNNLAAKATLEVLSDCPDFGELTAPNVTLSVFENERHERVENTTCDVNTFAAETVVSITTTVPRAVPEVTAFFLISNGYDGGDRRRQNCSGANDTDSICTRKLTLPTPGSYNLSLWLEHPGYAPKPEPIIYTCIIVDKRSDNLHLAIFIIGAFVILVFLICFLCCVLRCAAKRRKKKERESADVGRSTHDAEPAMLDAEYIPIVEKPRKPAPKHKSLPPTETDSMADSVDPYSCTCGVCPEKADGYCCNEIATLYNLINGQGQRCVTQATQFRSICHKQTLEKNISRVEQLEGAKRATGEWIWHTPKTTGFPACIESQLAKQFASSPTSTTVV